MENISQATWEQTSVRLPHFDEEVPAMRAVDGKLYIPVIALCSMLGIQADTHIRRWRHMLLWHGSLKLSYRGPHGYHRTVWCLPLPMVPFACCYVNWNLVPTERQTPLRQFVDEAIDMLYQAHLHMIDKYHKTRQVAFQFLTTIAKSKGTWREKAQRILPRLDEEEGRQFSALINQGESILTSAIAQARAIAHWTAETPVIDTYSLREHGALAAESTMPLLPVLPQDAENFFTSLEAWEKWYTAFTAFLDTHRF